MTKLRTAYTVQLCPKKGSGLNANGETLIRFSLLIHHRILQLDIMGVQREPGQKGVNWSNIAVGMCTLLFTSPDYALPTHATGAIMNMVPSYYLAPSAWLTIPYYHSYFASL